MIEFGTAIKCTSDPYHRHIVISDPQTNGGYVVLVCITTDGGSWTRDDDCILTPDEWPELDRKSRVAYSTCKCARVLGPLQRSIDSGEFEYINSPPEGTLSRIVMAGYTARGMTPEAKRYLPDV